MQLSAVTKSFIRKATAGVITVALFPSRQHQQSNNLTHRITLLQMYFFLHTADEKLSEQFNTARDHAVTVRTVFTRQEIKLLQIYICLQTAVTVRTVLHN